MEFGEEVRTRRRLVVLTAFVLTLLMAACTDSNLQMIPRKADINGVYCPATASVLGVPLRIMLIIDTSASMDENDPSDGRMVAGEQLINSFAPEADVRFSIVTFDDFATPATVDAAEQGVFSRDPNILGRALSDLGRADGFTNYLGALGEATTIIRNDLIATAKELKLLEEAGEDVDAMRPYYFIIFLSDGVPRVRGGIIQSSDEINYAVEQLIDVPDPALGATVHTAFLGAEGLIQDGKESQAMMAATLLRKMAENGRGKYYNFADGEAIDFKMFKFEIIRLHDTQQFIAYNRNAVLTHDGILVDSDGDNASDANELEIGTDLFKTDTDDDGLSDGYELLSGTNPNMIDPYCGARGAEDNDSDGLTDCEEGFRSFDPNWFDSDLDRLPDHFEFFSGGNPADRYDIKEDLDFDGRITGSEIIHRTDPNFAEDTDHYIAYAYEISHQRREERNASGKLERVCYPFKVGNVSIVDTLAVGSRAKGINEIVFEFIESPEDDPMKDFVLKRFVLQVQYKVVLDNSDGRFSVDLGEVEFEEIASQKVGIIDSED